MNARETAFIFIEFQNDFCSAGGKLHSSLMNELQRNHTLQNARRLLEGARKKDCLVIHCPFILDKEWVTQNECTGILSGILENQIFVPDTWGQAIIDSMKPEDGEVLLEHKHALSAFTNTNLDEILSLAGIQNLIICGFLTNICVQATAFSAYDRGLKTRIALDACGAATKEIQNFMEENLPSLLGGKSTVDEILSGIQEVYDSSPA
ncbi:MAG: cysteine hydrolase [Planctomycetia bacterium]|nr:cysteine hydrolase [Planctomycetia bacterium]